MKTAVSHSLDCLHLFTYYVNVSSPLWYKFNLNLEISCLYFKICCDLYEPSPGNTPFTSLVIRKHREGEVRATIPLSYLCVVDKQMLDKKNSGEFSRILFGPKCLSSLGNLFLNGNSGKNQIGRC